MPSCYSYARTSRPLAPRWRFSRSSFSDLARCRASLELLSATRRDFSFVRRYRIHSLARLWLPETRRGGPRGEDSACILRRAFSAVCAPRAPRPSRFARTNPQRLNSGDATSARCTRRRREEKRASLREKSLDVTARMPLSLSLSLCQYRCRFRGRDTAATPLGVREGVASRVSVGSNSPVSSRRLSPPRETAKSSSSRRIDNAFLSAASPSLACPSPSSPRLQAGINDDRWLPRPAIRSTIRRFLWRLRCTSARSGR